MERLDLTAIDISEANEKHYDFFFKLKCEENNIYWSGFEHKPDYYRLKEWFFKVIHEKSKKILIIIFNHTPAGYISFNVSNSNSSIDDFSIAVSDNFKGKGIASQAIERFIHYVKSNYTECKHFVSFIRFDNEPSKKIHLKNGFVMTDDFEDKYLESDKSVIRLNKWVKHL